MKKAFLATAAALSVAMTPAARAYENGVAPYPNGVTGEFIAEFPPIPGVSLLEQTDVSGASGLYGNTGDKQSFPPFKEQSVSTTPRILISYPFTLPTGIHVYSQIVPPVVFLNTELFGQKAHTSGLSNLDISPIILSWNLPSHLNIGLGLDFILPVGAYSSTKASVAEGYATYSPVLALRYDIPNGLDLGISNRFELNTENGTTHYSSAGAYDADFITAWNFGPLKLGASGGYLTQYGSDSANGLKLSATRLEQFEVGPSVGYFFKIAGKFPVVLNANFEFGAYARNTVKANNFWFNIAVPLFAAPPHG